MDEAVDLMELGRQYAAMTYERDVALEQVKSWKCEYDSMLDKYITTVDNQNEYLKNLLRRKQLLT
jgi:hypothetical protein